LALLVAMVGRVAEAEAWVRYLLDKISELSGVRGAGVVLDHEVHAWHLAHRVNGGRAEVRDVLFPAARRVGVADRDPERKVAHLLSELRVGDEVRLDGVPVDRVLAVAALLITEEARDL